MTALKEGGSSTVTVGTDTETIKSAITGFMDQYNKVQSLIEAKTSIETGSDGSVTAAVLPLAIVGEDAILENGRVALAPVVQSELIRSARFELVQVSPEQCRQWTGKTSWLTTDVFLSGSTR